MEILKVLFYIYLVGCVLSFSIIKLMDYISNNVDESFIPLSKNSEKIGIALSWIIVFYFIYSLFKMSGGGDAPISTTHYQNKDSDLIRSTINSYWVKAIKSPQFDITGKTPLKNSLLCKKYYRESAYYIGDKCRECPVFKCGYGCLSSEPFFRYRQAIDENVEGLRVNRAIKVAKGFEKVYNITKMSEN